MATTAASEYERQLLTPQRSYRVEKAKVASSKNLKITQNRQTLFNVHTSSPPFTSKTTVSIRQPGDIKGPILSSAELNSKNSTFAVFFGEPGVHDTVRVDEDLDAGMLDRNFKFCFNGQLYAWVSTCRHSIRIPGEDGTSVAAETNGQDWKLVSISASEPQMDGKILAVHMRERKDSNWHADSGAVSLHWFESTDEDVENIALTVIMGVMEREKRNKKEWSSGTSLLFG